MVAVGFDPGLRVVLLRAPLLGVRLVMRLVLLLFGVPTSLEGRPILRVIELPLVVRRL